MASHLDLEEQEQLDELKHFWKTYGNLISWLLIIVLGAYAGWNGYQYWQRNQAAKASALYDEVERAAASADLARVERSWSDMKDKFGSTTYAQQAALLAAKSLQAQGKPDEARAALKWVIDQSSDAAYRDLARLRMAALQLDAKAYDEALQLLSAPFEGDLSALAADLKGDVLMAKEQSAEAVSAYRQAWKAMPSQTEYRRLLQAKLNALGQDPEATATATSPAETQK
jgi:predicted negative regulator of RcsB-dependent stress response